MSAKLHNYIMEYCKRSRISSFECATLTPSALYLTCECALIGTRLNTKHPYLSPVLVVVPLSPS